MSYLMRDQDKIVKFILTKEQNTASAGASDPTVRQSRFVAVTDKLFDIAYRSKHDHCPFVLAVVLFHMILRALMLRVFYHRAAVALQSRYRYFKMQGKKAKVLGPAQTMQRC